MFQSAVQSEDESSSSRKPAVLRPKMTSPRPHPSGVCVCVCGTTAELQWIPSLSRSNSKPKRGIKDQSGKKQEILKDRDGERGKENRSEGRSDGMVRATGQ